MRLRTTTGAVAGGDGLSVSCMAGQSDWRDDETLSARIRAMRRGQRHQAAYLALRRLQAPLIHLEMPEGWGVDPAAVDALLRSGETHLDGDVNEDLQQAIAELSAAPLFESEIEPEFAESFQLEAISGWLMLAEALGEMTEVQTETVIYLARELADYLDRYMESSLTVVEGEAIHERYLAGIDDRLRSYGLGYFGSRNLEVEGVCHKAILAAPEGEDVLSSVEGHELLNACDEYSRQILSALQAFPVD